MSFIKWLKEIESGQLDLVVCLRWRFIPYPSTHNQLRLKDFKVHTTSIDCALESMKAIWLSLTSLLSLTFKIYQSFQFSWSYFIIVIYNSYIRIWTVWSSNLSFSSFSHSIWLNHEGIWPQWFGEKTFDKKSQVQSKWHWVKDTFCTLPHSERQNYVLGLYTSILTLFKCTTNALHTYVFTVKPVATRGCLTVMTRFWRTM